MSFSIDARSLPSIRSYGDAYRLWQSVDPIRGRGEDIRPIGDRRKDHMRVILNPDQSVALRLHNTDVVTYHPDNSITVRCWGSRSAVKFADALLPYGFSCLLHRGQMFVGLTRFHDHRRATTMRYAQGFEPLRFVPAEPSTGVMQRYKLADDCKPMTFTRRVVNREKAKQVRAKLAEFDRWAKALFLMGGGKYACQHGTPMGRSEVEAMLGLLDEAKTHPEVYERLLSAARKGVYGVVDATAIRCVYEYALVYFKAYKDEPVPVGELPKPNTV